jgi:hypothetical protein
LPDLAAAFDYRLGEKTFRFRPIEFRMNSGDVIEQLRNPDPTRQHCDIGNERDIAHELVARVPRITSEDSQLSFI